MKIIKWLLVLLLTGLTYGQGNLFFTSDTTSGDSLMLDLSYDTEVIQSEYGYTQQETRAIAIYRTGAWTNDSMAVYAAVDADSPYVAIYFNEAVLTLVGTTGADYIIFDPRHFAGIRYLKLVFPATEAAKRSYTIVRRRY